jgi:hypothetical protein
LLPWVSRISWFIFISLARNSGALRSVFSQLSIPQLTVKWPVLLVMESMYRSGGTCWALNSSDVPDKRNSRKQNKAIIYQRWAEYEKHRCRLKNDWKETNGFTWFLIYCCGVIRQGGACWVKILQIFLESNLKSILFPLIDTPRWKNNVVTGVYY